MGVWEKEWECRRMRENVCVGERMEERLGELVQ